MNNNLTKDTTKEEWLDQYKIYPSTMEGGLDEKPWYENRILPIFYEIPMKSKVLDIGCNDGTFLTMLRDKRKCDVVGVDISEVMIEVCKAKGLDVKLTNDEILPFADQSFDVVSLMEVIALTYDSETLLKEIKRVLKKDGILLGSTPHKNIEKYLWDDKRLHRRYYDEVELDSELSKQFQNVHIKILNGAQFALSMAQSHIADMKAEILFKCGGKGTLGFDAALEDKSVLRAWFGMTQTPGTAYYRMSGFCDKMQEMGAETFYEPYDHRDFNSCADWQRKVRFKHVQHQLNALMKASDVSVWQITQSWDVLALLMCIKDLFQKPIISEIDDWLFDIPSYNMASNPYHPNSDNEKIAFKQIEISDYVICSTRFIKDNLLTIFPDKKIYVIKNSLDFKIWDHITEEKTFEDKKEGTIRIGYTGCGNHSGDLELVKKPILALLDEFTNLEFVLPQPFDSWIDVTHPRLRMNNKWVVLPRFPGMVKGWDLDIGIAPLRDNNLNRAKSNLRWLEYSALKLPTVASDIYPFHNSISDDKDGLLVRNSNKNWYEVLRSLIVDKEKRNTIGMNAYKKVRKEYSMDDVAKTYLSILKEIKHEFGRNPRRVRTLTI